MRLTTRHLTVPVALGAVVALTAFAAVAPASAQEEEQEKEADVTVELAPVNQSGISGAATIYSQAREEAGQREEMAREGGEEEKAMHDHRVVLQLSGLEAGQSYPAHIHRGTCAEGGPVFHALGSVQAGGGGEGTATVTVSAEEIAAKMKEMKEQKQGQEKAEGAEHEHPSLFVMAHLPDGTPAACGDIPMEHEKDEGGESY